MEPDSPIITNNQEKESTTASQYIIELAKHNEYIKYQEVMSGLGWDPMNKLYLILPEIDPNGLFLGKINNKVISCVVALKYGKKFGFLAVYWVKKSHRGQGYGKKIFDKAIEYLSDCEAVHLDGVEDQVHNYQKSGFKKHCINSKRRVPVFDYEPHEIMPNSLTISDRKAIDIEKLCEYDRTAFPFDRSKMLKKSIQIGYPVVSVDKDRNIQGYAILMESEIGLTVSPLVAENIEIAEDLIKACLQFGRSFKLGKYQQYLCLIIIALYERKEVEELIKKWFPGLIYECSRMIWHTEHYSGVDFDRSKIYANGGFERG